MGPGTLESAKVDGGADSLPLGLEAPTPAASSSAGPWGSLRGLGAIEGLEESWSILDHRETTQREEAEYGPYWPICPLYSLSRIWYFERTLMVGIRLLVFKY